MIGSRYVTDSVEEPLSLHFATGDRFENKNRKYELREDPNSSQQAVLIASERLNEDSQEWQDVPGNHFFTVDKKGAIEFTAI